MNDSIISAESVDYAQNANMLTHANMRIKHRTIHHDTLNIHY